VDWGGYYHKNFRRTCRFLYYITGNNPSPSAQQL